MPGRFPPRYDATGAVIRRGDCVLVLVEGQPVVGVVRTVSTIRRRVEVWVSRRAVSHGNTRRRTFRRAEVSPIPYMPRLHWPAPLARAA